MMNYQKLNHLKQKNYQLANIRRKEMKLRALRQDILASAPEEALDMILDAPAPASLIQSFPDQDLYYLIHKIGPYDCIPILALARSDQWEYMLDVEVWDRDRLNTAMMTKTFDLLFQADPERFLRWTIMEKSEFLEFYLFRHMDIRIREHDEIPPDDFKDYVTLDDKFYIRFPINYEVCGDSCDPNDPNDAGFKAEADSEYSFDDAELNEFIPENQEEARELIEKMLRKLADMDLSVYHGLLLETASILPAEAEEEQFRLKSVRLAEKGFLPPHEAIGIYQPTKLSAFRKRPQNPAFKKVALEPDFPMPPQYFSGLLEGEYLLMAAIRLVDSDFGLELESELAALINKIVSADRIKLREKEDMDKAVIKARDFLNLGLEVMLKGELSSEAARDVLNGYFLEDIFRTASRAGIMLKTKAVNWFKESFLNRNRLPLSFLGEIYLGVTGGLFLERPLYFDNYESGSLYRNFRSIPDLTRTDRLLDEMIALDRVLAYLNVDISTFREGVLTYKTLILTLWAKNRLGLSPDLEPIDMKVFQNFFKALFPESDSGGSRKIQLSDLSLFLSEATGLDEKDMGKAFHRVLAELIDELESEYDQVKPYGLDSRFIPHFILK